MEDSVESGVESGADSGVESTGLPDRPLALELLGPLVVTRGDAVQPLPPSRKVRALLAYLAASSQPLPRDRLCELLWDVPNDPRGELRWCLSKLRGVLDEPGRPRVVASGDAVRLELDGARVDALELDRAFRTGLGTATVEALRALAGRFRGDFLEGLDLPRSAAFGAWLVARRRHFRAGHATVLERLAGALPGPSDEVVDCLETWLELAPFNLRAHERLFEALAASGQWREGDEHLAATARRYEAEGREWAAVGHAWRAARSRHAARVEVPVAAPDAGAGLPAQADERRRLDASGIEVALAPAAALASATAPGRRASLAVMPFVDAAGRSAPHGRLGHRLAHDVITRLAKLRSLFVIAQGSVFALDARRVGGAHAGRRLEVDYVAGGSLRYEPGGGVTVSVELTDTRTARVLWAEVFTGRPGEALTLLDPIGDCIVAAIASQIEVAERNRAVLKAPNSLDAWEAHHRGLWHVMRFNDADNALARRFFETALRLDPTFARPYAGLSFTHFQDAFLGWAERDAAVEAAYRAGSQALMVDELDPAAHWALGRAHWLRGGLDDALRELGACVALSPNFALGHYTLAFVHAQSGDPQAAIGAADLSRRLSPFDPLLFGMLGARAMALMRLGRHDEAADAALQAAAQPNAHVHILAIALHCLTLAGRRTEAGRVAAAIQQTQPGYRVDDYLAAFRFDADGETLIRQAAGLSTPTH